MQRLIIVSREYYEEDADIKEAVDFIVGKEMMKIGHKENLERLLQGTAE